MDNNENKENKDKKITLILKICGGVFTILGFAMFILGVVTVSGLFGGDFQPESYIWIIFVGFGLIFVGSIFAKISSSFKISKIFKKNKDVIDAHQNKNASNYYFGGNSSDNALDSFNLENDAEADAKGVVCPKCGTKNEIGAKFCDNCGASLVKRCDSCGEENDIDAKFCRKCGKRL